MFFAITTIALETIQANYLGIAILLLLVMLTALFPVYYRSYSFVLFQWVSVAAFLLYGFFIEMLITQVAILLSLMVMKVRRDHLERIPLNSVMFFFTSVISAIIYYALSALKLPFDPYNMLAILGYITSFLFVNLVLIYFLRNKVLKIKTKLFDEGFRWGILTCLIVLPLGFILILVFELGFLPIMLVAVSFIGASAILRLYSLSETMNWRMKLVNDLGYQLNQSLSPKDVVEIFTDKMKDIIEIDYLHLYATNKNKLKIVRTYHKKPLQEDIAFEKEDKISELALRTNEWVISHSRKDWPASLEKLYKGAESIVAIPINHHNRTIGVLTLASKEGKAFKKNQLIILEYVANFLAVAYDNAKHYEKTKEESIRCSLTALYNFRYFERLLTKEYEKHLQEQKHVSIIMLDIDYFKSINDTYGHQAGNEILCQLARLLEQVIGDSGTVARYGGEEFLVLLPNTSAKQARQIAERIRHEIESHEFHIENDLQAGERITHSVTASIGVATSNLEELNPMTVVRLADRAMYIGAKQKGRNRVASFEELEEPSL